MAHSVWITLISLLPHLVQMLSGYLSFKYNVSSPRTDILSQRTVGKHAHSPWMVKSLEMASGPFPLVIRHKDLSYKAILPTTSCKTGGTNTINRILQTKKQNLSEVEWLAKDLRAGKSAPHLSASNPSGSPSYSVISCCLIVSMVSDLLHSGSGNSPLQVKGSPWDVFLRMCSESS